MMYHFMFGLRGGSAAEAGSAFLTSAPTGSSALASMVPFFSSSCIRCFAFRFLPTALVAGRSTEQPVDAVSQYVIHHRKIDPEEKDGDDDYGCGGAHFLERRRGHLLHLGAHVVVESLDPLRPGLQRAECAFFHDSRHQPFLLSGRISPPGPTKSALPKSLAGAEGFEPPSPVLETGSLTVELTPLSLLSNFVIG